MPARVVTEATVICLGRGFPGAWCPAGVGNNPNGICVRDIVGDWLRPEGKGLASMNDDREERRSEADAEVEREIRQGRKLSTKEAMARLAGPGAMKGASPVSPVQQAETEIGTWLRSHLADEAGALHVPLHRHLKGSQLLLDNLDQPLVALAAYCEQLLASDHLMKELVREADVEWGRRMDERPHFEREGHPQHPSDPYTFESVSQALEEVRMKLAELTRACPSAGNDSAP